MLIDADDNAHFVKQIKLTTELLQNLQIINPSDLWKDIDLIEQNDVNDELFYELIHETIPQDFEIKFDFIGDKRCLLHIYDSARPIPNSILTSFGMGGSDFEAMKSATINAYKQLLVLLKPLIGKGNPQHHQKEESHPGRLVHGQNQVATET